MTYIDLALGTRKILAHYIRMQKNPQAKEDIPGFLRIFMGLCGSKVQFAPLHRNFISFGNYFVLTVFLFLKKKNAYFERKLIKYLMELIWVGSNHLKVFCKMDALRSWFFEG